MYDQQNIIVTYATVVAVASNYQLENLPTSFGDGYQVTWLTTGENEFLDFGTDYNGFVYADNLDKYSFYALPITTQHYNTTWSFFK